MPDVNCKIFLFFSLKMWLVIFPEGTRFNPDSVEQKMQSHEFARSRGIY